MKGFKVGLLAALTLALAGIASAQYETKETTTTTTTTKTVTGTVVSTTPTLLVVRTDSGTQMTFDLDASSTLPAITLVPGNLVTIDYNTIAPDDYRATVVRTGPATTTTRTTTTTRNITGEVISKTPTLLVVRTESGTQMSFYLDASSTLPATTIVPGNTVTIDYNTIGTDDYRATVVRMSPATTATRATTTTTDRYDDNLPETAGPLPWIVFTGLVALGSAFGLRMKRRRAQQQSEMFPTAGNR